MPSKCNVVVVSVVCGPKQRNMNLEHLINLVQDRSPIYDPSHPLHRNRDAISASWKDIATEMNCKGKFYYHSFYLFNRVWNIVAR